jgi:thiamine biosynthesis lipoprotein
MTALAAPPRTVHVEPCMGTVFSIDVRDAGDWSEPIARAVAWLHHVDRVFSTYRSDSVISRLQRGVLRIDECPPEVGEVLRLCARAQADTRGFFTAVPNGRLDPTGLVKGWAVERASRLLVEAGARNHAISGGGDMQLAGRPAPDRPWRVGIADPHRPGRLVATVEGVDVAVATSGTAERGAHVVDPFTGRAATALASVTVVGPSLTVADAYATAALAMGAAARDWLDTVDGYDGFAVAADASTWATAGSSVWWAHRATTRSGKQEG